jgi:hypothetical protein
MAAKKSGSRRYSRGASKNVEGAMRRRKRGTLKRGKGGRGGKVKSRKQAIAIGLSEARAKGKKVPRKRSAKKSTRKRSTTKRSTTKRSTTKRASARKGGRKSVSKRR